MPPPEASQPGESTILIVEDEPHIARFVQFILERDGYSAKTVSSGEEAKLQMLKTRYSVVLLDLGLPGCSGTDVLHWIRGRADHKDTRVVILSSKSVADMARQALAAGADAHCCKPVAPSILLKTLGDLCIPKAHVAHA